MRGCLRSRGCALTPVPGVLPPVRGVRYLRLGGCYLRFRKWGPGFEREPPVGGRRGADGGPIDHPTPTTRTHPPATHHLSAWLPGTCARFPVHIFRVSIMPIITTSPYFVPWGQCARVAHPR